VQKDRCVKSIRLMRDMQKNNLRRNMVHPE
jgi:hypothetical protein